MISCSRSTIVVPQDDRKTRERDRLPSRGARARLPRALPLLDRSYRRQCRDNDLLAAFYLDQEALAIEVPIGVEMHVEQYAGIVFDADCCPMHCLGELLAIELADLFGDRLDHVHSTVSLHPVVVAFIS